MNIIPYDDSTIVTFCKEGQKFPVGFYIEQLNQYENIYYINTISTGLLPGQWRELCTEDSIEAKQWIDLSTELTLYNFNETEKYFEEWGVNNKSEYVLYFRVHKCSYIDLSLNDKFNKTDTLGYFNRRPLDEYSFKELIEYLWFNYNHQLGNDKILYTEFQNSGEKFIYRLYVTQYIEGDFGMCPVIQIYCEEFKIDKISGLILQKSNLIRKLLSVIAD
ncbi:MAG: hypothetical protein IPM56_08215 [Ignavibacteriales bacterium]|nr:MAG: hypothetical protein IPM56_08215 [Ignavibacteriales bacterium]